MSRSCGRDIPTASLPGFEWSSAPFPASGTAPPCQRSVLAHVSSVPARPIAGGRCSSARPERPHASHPACIRRRSAARACRPATDRAPRTRPRRPTRGSTAAPSRLLAPSRRRGRHSAVARPRTTGRIRRRRTEECARRRRPAAGAAQGPGTCHRVTAPRLGRDLSRSPLTGRAIRRPDALRALQCVPRRRARGIQVVSVPFLRRSVIRLVRTSGAARRLQRILAERTNGTLKT